MPDGSTDADEHRFCRKFSIIELGTTAVNPKLCWFCSATDEETGTKLAFDILAGMLFIPATVAAESSDVLLTLPIIAGIDGVAPIPDAAVRDETGDAYDNGIFDSLLDDCDSPLER